MTGFTDPAPVLEELDAALQTRFLDTNCAIAAGLNSYLKVTGDKAFRIATPKQDEEDSEPLQQFFPQRHYVPLTEILARSNCIPGSPRSCNICARHARGRCLTRYSSPGSSASDAPSVRPRWRRSLPRSAPRNSTASSTGASPWKIS